MISLKCCLFFLKYIKYCHKSNIYFTKHQISLIIILKRKRKMNLLNIKKFLLLLILLSRICIGQCKFLFFSGYIISHFSIDKCFVASEYLSYL
jgi:hypothetical protein